MRSREYNDEALTKGAESALFPPNGFFLGEDKALMETMRGDEMGALIAKTKMLLAERLSQASSKREFSMGDAFNQVKEAVMAAYYTGDKVIGDDQAHTIASMIDTKLIAIASAAVRPMPREI